MTAPRLRGSGGGNDRQIGGTSGGRGGGRLELIARVARLDGVVEARGGAGYYQNYYLCGAGGSGGSILINATVLTGNATAAMSVGGGNSGGCDLTCVAYPSVFPQTCVCGPVHELDTRCV
jgi:hypothetical protein